MKLVAAVSYWWLVACGFAGLLAILLAAGLFAYVGVIVMRWLCGVERS